MRTIFYLLLFFFCLLLAPNLAAQIQDAALNNAPNYTPTQVWEKLKWMPKAKVSGTMVHNASFHPSKSGHIVVTPMLDAVHFER